MRVPTDVRAVCSFTNQSTTRRPRLCRPKAHKMAVSCPAAIYVDLSFDYVFFTIPLKMITDVNRFVIQKTVSGVIKNQNIVTGLMNSKFSAVLRETSYRPAHEKNERLAPQRASTKLCPCQEKVHRLSSSQTFMLLLRTLLRSRSVWVWVCCRCLVGVCWCVGVCGVCVGVCGAAR